MKVLVCGGREYENEQRVKNVLDLIHENRGPITHVIHGSAEGADLLADQWAWKNGIQPVACDANWSRYGKRAGHERNSRMLDLYPILVVAFPGGAGTMNCVEQAQRRGIEVQMVDHANI